MPGLGTFKNYEANQERLNVVRCGISFVINPSWKFEHRQVQLASMFRFYVYFCKPISYILWFALYSLINLFIRSCYILSICYLNIWSAVNHSFFFTFTYYKDLISSPYLIYVKFFHFQFLFCFLYFYPFCFFLIHFLSSLFFLPFIPLPITLYFSLSITIWCLI